MYEMSSKPYILYVDVFFPSLFMALYLFIADPEEIDTGLLQFCSTQLKLLQLYTDIQQLHSAMDGETCFENVRGHTCTCKMSVNGSVSVSR